jgi:hypothetical protein
LRELAALLLPEKNHHHQELPAGSFCSIQRKIASKPICSLMPPHMKLQEIDYLKNYKSKTYFPKRAAL